MFQKHLPIKHSHRLIDWAAGTLKGYTIVRLRWQRIPPETKSKFQNPPSRVNCENQIDTKDDNMDEKLLWQQKPEDKIFRQM